MAFKYFNVKNGLTAGNISLNTSNATIETGNLIVSGDSNLGSVSNLTIIGGTNGQVLTTDGSGNLSFSSGSSNPAPMPYQIDTGETVTVPDKYQGLFAYPITVDGELEIDGILIEVGQDALESVSGQILYDNNGIPSGNAGFTFDPVTGNLAAPGNVTATYFIGNGSQLTGITAAAGSNISNGISNVSIPSSGGNVTVSVGGTGNIIIATSSGANVLGTFNASGNANVANIGATEGVFSANVTAFNVYANAGLVSAQTLKGEGGNISNIQGSNVSGAVGSATTAGTVTSASQGNITSVGVLTGLVMAGNITPNVSNTYNLGNSDNRWNNLFLSGNTIYLGNASIGSDGNSVTITNPDGGQMIIAGNGTASSNTIYNGNSNLSIPTSNGNIILSAAGNSNVVVVSGTGANITGTLNVSANANVGNLGATAVDATTLGGSLTTASQPNITSVGTLSSLTVTNKVTAGQLQGEGGNISNIQGANISGAVASATSATSATTAGTVTTNAQPNITSVGTLSSLTVTNKITAGQLQGDGGNISNIQGANVSGTVASATTAGTVTTAAQPNVTSVGTLSSLDVTGNITSGANIVTDLIVGKTTSVSIAATGSDQNIYLKPTGTGSVDVWGKVLGNLATPVASTDAATKQYVDDFAQGLHTHDSCGAATPDTLANISSGTVTYNNGTNGVGATLTTTGSYTTIDSVNVASAGFRILVKSEANAAHNGIYTYTSSTVLTRATDFNTSVEMAGGDFTFVTGGTLYDNTGWVMTDPVTTVGTTAVNWTQFSGAGTYTAGTGLTLTGSQFSITNTTITAGSYGNGDSVATFTVNSQGQLTAAANVAIAANAANLTGTTLASTINSSNLTSVGTLSSLTVTNKVTAGQLQGDGGNISNVQAANISGTVATATTAGTVTTAAQPNITSTGTLTSLTVTGNASAGNLNTAGKVVASTVESNVATGTAPLAVASTTRVANLNVAYANVADFVNVTAPDTGTGYVVFANATSGNVSELVSSGITSNLANNSITATTFVGALSGAATTAGTVTTNAQPNITSTGTLANLTVSGDVNLAASSGNVGIGNSSPGQKLTVAGTIESTSGGVKFPDGTTQTSAGINTGKSIAMAMIFGG